MKQLNRNIDDWFIGYKTYAIKPKRSQLSASNSPNKTKSFVQTRLKLGSGLTNLKAAAAKKPEVMVKIAKRVSQDSNGMKGVKNHIKYISRNGELPLETKYGELLRGKDINKLMKEWQNLGISDHSKQREAINVILSMPAGTPPQAVLNAAREFAAEQFDHHQYALALHHESEKKGEPPHPHVHLCVLMRDENGKRLNPRKNDLFEWRVRFAEKLREQGVECAATRRQHRGQTIKGQRAEIRAMLERILHEQQQGKPTDKIKGSHIAKQNAQTIQAAIARQQRPQHPFQEKVERSRQHITQQYALIARELFQMGYKSEARIMGQFAKEVSKQGFETQAQKKFDEYQHAFRQPEHLSHQKNDNGIER